MKNKILIAVSLLALVVIFACNTKSDDADCVDEVQTQEVN